MLEGVGLSIFVRGFSRCIVSSRGGGRYAGDCGLLVVDAGWGVGVEFFLWEDFLSCMRR